MPNQWGANRVKIRRRRPDAVGTRNVRRGFILGALSATIFPRAARLASAQQATLPRYCSLDPNVDLRRYRARSSTGNPALDRALIAELRKIIRVFSVNPGFRIIDDEGQPNAFAVSTTMVPNTLGTVLFGLALITDQMAITDGGNTVAGIAAHECAHIFQFTSAYGARLTAGQRTAKALELHADFLAGYYLAVDRRTAMNVEMFARALYERADWNFNDPSHHGTPVERVNAAKAGYAAGRDGMTFSDAARTGLTFVL